MTKIKRNAREQEEKENTKKSRPFKQMPHRKAPVSLLSPGINTGGTTLSPCSNFSMSRGVVSTNQTFFASETCLDHFLIELWISTETFSAIFHFVLWRWLFDSSREWQFIACFL